MQLNVIFFFDLFSHEINILFRLDFPKKKKKVSRELFYPTAMIPKFSRDYSAKCGVESTT